MIAFPTVTQEIRSLLSRRQELNTFLGSVFAAGGVFLQNALGGNLPTSLLSVEEHLFSFYAVVIMAPSLILALRMARLHGGMVLNGMLYARLLQGQDFTTRGDVTRAAAHNFLGVSFLQFLLAAFIAAFSATVLALSLETPIWVGLAGGAAVFLAWLALYFRFHHRSVAFALKRIETETCAGVTRAEWVDHVSASLHDANHELIGIIGFVGLITFSVFEVMSGLGRITMNRPPDLRGDHIHHYGAAAYTLLMFVTCLMGLMTYLRVRVAIGRFSLDLDPNDRPFRRLVLTDSLLGYLLLAFFLAVSVHFSLVQFAPSLRAPVVLLIDSATLLIAVSAEQATLGVAGRCSSRTTTTPRQAPVVTAGDASPTPGNAFKQMPHEEQLN